MRLLLSSSSTHAKEGVCGPFSVESITLERAGPVLIGDSLFGAGIHRNPLTSDKRKTAAGMAFLMSRDRSVEPAWFQ
jgi:hypothetical protein